MKGGSKQSDRHMIFSIVQFLTMVRLALEMFSILPKAELVPFVLIVIGESPRELGLESRDLMLALRGRDDVIRSRAMYTCVSSSHCTALSTYSFFGGARATGAGAGGAAMNGFDSGGLCSFFAGFASPPALPPVKKTK